MQCSAHHRPCTRPRRGFLIASSAVCGSGRRQHPQLDSCHPPGHPPAPQLTGSACRSGRCTAGRLLPPSPCRRRIAGRSGHPCCSPHTSPPHTTGGCGSGTGLGKQLAPAVATARGRAVRSHEHLTGTHCPAASGPCRGQHSRHRCLSSEHLLQREPAPAGPLPGTSITSAVAGMLGSGAPAGSGAGDAPARGTGDTIGARDGEDGGASSWHLGSAAATAAAAAHSEAMQGGVFVCRRRLRRR